MARKRSPRKAPAATDEAADAVASKRASRSKKKPAQPVIAVRHMSRRDINRVWDFLKLSFREVNAETVEYQRPRSKLRFEEVYEEEGIEQLLFEVDGDIVAYAECSYEVIGSDNWINPRYFEKRDMRPLFVRALAWYKKRAFKKLDAAIFMACPVDIEPELLPPRELPPAREVTAEEPGEG